MHLHVRMQCMHKMHCVHMECTQYSGLQYSMTSIRGLRGASWRLYDSERSDLCPGPRGSRVPYISW